MGFHMRTTSELQRTLRTLSLYALLSLVPLSSAFQVTSPARSCAALGYHSATSCSRVAYNRAALPRPIAGLRASGLDALLFGDEQSGHPPEDLLGGQSFRAYPSAVDCSPAHASNLLEDCKKVYDLSTKGTAFWVWARDEPRCGLERMAKDIFEHYAAGTDFDPATSGVEWWVQVREGGSGAEAIGMHWDKDEELARLCMGLNAHPSVATVTYLSAYGAPTVVLSHRAPERGGGGGKRAHKGAIEEGWVSMPREGKHIAFDGRLLHGAPSQLISPAPGSTRVTFLANVWCGHVPMGVARLPPSILPPSPPPHPPHPPLPPLPPRPSQTARASRPRPSQARAGQRRLCQTRSAS